MPAGILKPAGGVDEAGQDAIDVVGPPSRALTISDRSGGSAPFSAARAACSLGNGERNWLAGVAGPVLRLALVVDALRHRHRGGDRLDLRRVEADARQVAVVQLRSSSGSWSRPWDRPGSRAARRPGRRPPNRPAKLHCSFGSGGVSASCASAGPAATRPSNAANSSERSARIMPSPSAWRRRHWAVVRPLRPAPARLMLSGSGSGRSSLPRIGSSTRKWKK